MVPPSSDRISRVPPYSRTRADRYPYGPVTLCGGAFQLLPVDRCAPLAWSAFARRYSRSRGCFPFLRLLRCFSSPGSPRHAMDSRDDTPKGVGCPIRRSRDRRSLAPPPGFSQRATSFIASRCQGIHQMPSLHSPRSRRSPPKRARILRHARAPAPARPMHTHAPAPSPAGEGTRMRKTSSSSRCRKNPKTRSLRAARGTPDPSPRGAAEDGGPGPI